MSYCLVRTMKRLNTDGDLYLMRNIYIYCYLRTLTKISNKKINDYINIP